ncbi:MAG TPA: outer membrane beta-barrel protein, partial [Chryseosolibacter sp.]|nr:outer membrane beta-barrel protein [Chryseosolibacter sp.]
DIFYAMMDNNNPVDSLRASNEGVVVSGRLFGNYNFSKGWGAQFFSFYRGRQVQLQGTQGGFYMYSLGFRKEFNEKRGSVGLAAENFLQSSIKMRTEVESPLLRQSRLNTRNTLSFRVTFTYRIGKMSMDDRPRRKRSINNDDLKDEGGSDGGMQMGGEGVTPQGGNGQGGARQRMPAQNSKPAAQPPVASTDSTKYEAAGKWSYTIDSPQGGGGTIVLKRDGEDYSGTIQRDRMMEPVALESVAVKGNDISFSYPATFGGNTIAIRVQARISKDSMTGTMQMGETRSFNLSGKRTE